MKLFTNKQFQRVLERELAPLKQENEELREKINKKEFRFLEEKNNLEKQVEEYKGIIETEEEFIQKLKVKIEKLTPTKGYKPDVDKNKWQQRIDDLRIEAKKRGYKI